MQQIGPADELPFDRLPVEIQERIWSCIPASEQILDPVTGERVLTRRGVIALFEGMKRYSGEPPERIDAYLQFLFDRDFNLPSELL